MCHLPTSRPNRIFRLRPKFAATHTLVEAFTRLESSVVRPLPDSSADTFASLGADRSRSPPGRTGFPDTISLRGAPESGAKSITEPPGRIPAPDTFLLSGPPQINRSGCGLIPLSSIHNINRPLPRSAYRIVSIHFDRETSNPGVRQPCHDVLRRATHGRYDRCRARAVKHHVCGSHRHASVAFSEQLVLATELPLGRG